LHGAFWHYALKSGRQSSVVSRQRCNSKRITKDG
jgi:hypothetical protein